MGTITLFYKDNSESCMQAIHWLEAHHIDIDKKRVETITHHEIFRLIYLAELDIPDILTDIHKYSISYQTNKKHLRRLRFGESLKFLEKHTELLEVPIILSNRGALLGYDEHKMENILGW